ncbi:monovalent cation/H+ antiporter complex subunit F [Microcella frigidaquae]|uniref:Multicomponent Na+:H+ antiporter subunit F n=1 Tax=Microcella frigidaquae TaxID=424758 RepID=A0A840X7R5_9MICO|nr:monovalent cation/H+ antiporter complex subunit F [Microcella frigidaquae]MBB5618593.1 multicomponent Na+:H+ antiporter subunit F [Microcella frigidaquae]NHN44029.1 sodium:proton antiporter [Microcella frigidaquae]
MTAATVLWIVAGVIAVVAVLLILTRLIAGPTLIDRLIASDVMLTTLILVIGAEMVISGHTLTIPLMVVLAATGVLGSTAVARFVSRAGADAPAEPGGDHDQH